MKTVHIVVGIAAISGLAWYIRNKRQASGQTTMTSQTNQTTEVITTNIPMPASEVEATKIIKLPGTLLSNTSGNTGIIPPVLKTGATPIKTFASVGTPILQQKNLQGFALN